MSQQVRPTHKARVFSTRGKPTEDSPGNPHRLRLLERRLRDLRSGNQPHLGSGDVERGTGNEEPAALEGHEERLVIARAL